MCFLQVYPNRIKVPRNGTKKEVTELKKVLSWILCMVMLLSHLLKKLELRLKKNER